MGEKCNHNIKSKNTTIHLFDRTFMTFPNVRYAVCPICGKEFKFIEKEAGKLERLKKYVGEMGYEDYRSLL